MTKNKVGSAVAASLAMMVWAGSAFAGTFCVDDGACKATDACFGGMCVPKDRLCKDTTGCKAWQVCDMTCPGMPSSGSTGSGGGQTGCASSDGDACSTEPSTGDTASSDAGSAGGMPKMDGGSSGAPMPPPPEDAGSSEKKMPPQDASSDPMPDSAGLVQPPPTCPKDQGICIADLKKVTIQPGCKELCAAAVSCNFMSGGDATGGPTPAPPPKEGDGEQGFAPPADASSGKPSAPDAGNGDQAMEMDASMADVSGPPPMDAGPAGDGGTPQASEIEQCEAMCSVWKLEQVAAPELTALEQCIAAHKVCADMNVACVANAEAFQKAASENDLWMLGMGGTTESTGGPKNTGGDAGSTDTATTATAPQGADAASSADSKLASTDSASTAAATPASSSSSSGCTAAPASANSPWALAGLGLIGLAFVWLRRRATV